jgi:polysaccharide deacetylase 2 family uncharacterized protein YibQ
MRRRPAKRRTSFGNIALLMLLPVAGLILFLGWRFLSTNPSLQRLTARASQTRNEASVLGRVKPATRSVAAPRPAPLVAAVKPGRIVLILDDVGFDHQRVADAMRIDPNLNFAVIPNGVKAGETAKTLNARGFEILCHMPMEPDGFPKISPGDGAILTSMTDAEIREAATRNFAAVPFAVGMNNHMGSRATADPRVMRNVFAALPKGTYFIDSRTTPKSIAGSLARELDIRTASRSVFLDDVQSESAIRRQLAELAAEASQHGVAVGIGHIYPVTVKVLGEEVPALRGKGFRFIRASAMVD